LAEAGETGVPQVSKPAVWPISKSAGRRECAAFAGLETRDTADLEVCGTGLPMKYPGWHDGDDELWMFHLNNWGSGAALRPAAR